MMPASSLRGHGRYCQPHRSWARTEPTITTLSAVLTLYLVILPYTPMGRSETVLSISEARALPNGEPVVVEGTVSVEPGTFTTHEIYIQDESAGIQVYGYGLNLTHRSMNLGDLVRVSGTREVYKGKTYISITSLDDVSVLTHGEVPVPRTVRCGEVGEGTEGLLVRIAGTVSHLHERGWTMEDTTGTSEVYLYYPTGLDPIPMGIREGLAVAVTGVVGQYDESPPYTTGYSVYPRSAEDIVVLSPPELVSKSPTDTKITMEPGRRMIFQAEFRGEQPQISWYVNGEFAGTGRTYTFEPHGPGRYNVTVRAVDLAGTSEQSWEVRVVRAGSEERSYLLPAGVLAAGLLAVLTMGIAVFIRNTRMRDVKALPSGEPSTDRRPTDGRTIDSRPTARNEGRPESAGHGTGGMVPGAGTTPLPTPAPERPARMRRVVLLKEGHSYLVEGENLRPIFRVFRDGMEQGRKGLCITRSNPRHIERRFALKDAEIWWLTELTGAGRRIAPVLEKVISIIENFAERYPGSIILLDGLEYLISNRGFDPVRKFVQTVVDELSETSSILLIPVNPGTMEEKSIHFLEREMEFVRIGDSMKVAPPRGAADVDRSTNRRH